MATIFMRWPHCIRVAYAPLFLQRGHLLLVGSLVLICCSGCTLTWISRRPDLRTTWLDINSYRRLSLGFERRHLDPPSIQEINEFRWLHGPVSNYSSTAATVSEVEDLPDREVVGTDFLKKIPVSSEPPGLPVESLHPDFGQDSDQVGPPPLHTPASTMPEMMPEKEKSRIPVEIELPPLESLREPPEGNNSEEQWRQKGSNLEGPTALRFLRRPAVTAIQPTSFDSPNAALPGASMLFVRP